MKVKIGFYMQTYVEQEIETDIDEWELSKGLDEGKYFTSVESDELVTLVNNEYEIVGKITGQEFNESQFFDYDVI